MKMAIISNSEGPGIRPANFLHTLRSVATSYVITVLLLFGLSIMLTYTNLSDNLITAGVIIIAAASNFIGGAIIAKRTRSAGWLNGAIAGIIYMLILYLIGLIVNAGQVYEPNLFAMLAVGLFAGSTGGIFGINSNSNRKKKQRRR